MTYRRGIHHLTMVTIRAAQAEECVFGASLHRVTVRLAKLQRRRSMLEFALTVLRKASDHHESGHDHGAHMAAQLPIAARRFRRRLALALLDSRQYAGEVLSSWRRAPQGLASGFGAQLRPWSIRATFWQWRCER